MHPSQHSLPTAATLQATLSLLDDPDPRVVAACRAQLIEWGPSVRELVQCAATHDNPRMRVHARSVLMSFERTEWRQELDGVSSRLLASPARFEGEELLDAVLLASRLGNARAVDGDACRERLFDWSQQLLARLRRCRTASASARALGDLLGGEIGFHGARLRGAVRADDGPRDLHAVCLDSVVERRSGVALALCVVYLAVGRAAGLQMSGVALPDHFLVRVHGTRPVIVDPFHGGRAITKADCLRYLRARGHVERASEHLVDREDAVVFAAFVERLARTVAPSGSDELRAALQDLRRGLLS